MTLTRMTEREALDLGMRLGHTAWVSQVRKGYVVSCTCGWRSNGITLERTAEQTGLHHMADDARQLEAEAATAGLTLEQALELRNGRVRMRHNGSTATIQERAAQRQR